MIEGIRLLKNIGQFENVTPSADTNFKPMSFIYAENGRGKTTLASIFRSLATNNPELVMERHRLGAQQPPHIVFDFDNANKAVFEEAVWSRHLPQIAIFDDDFVSANVCSGVEINTSHRQKLHELILGYQGVDLNTLLQAQVSLNEQHNTRLRLLGSKIPENIRSPFSIDEFCALERDADIDTKIADGERRVAAAQSADSIQRQPLFAALTLPSFNTAEINNVLGQTLADLETSAAEMVNAHVSKLQDRGEEWISKGVHFITPISEGMNEEHCPFCTQSLEGVDVIDHYRAYFGDNYESLKSEISDLKRAISDSHGGDIPAAFERSIAQAKENLTFWGQFTRLVDIDIDTAAISLSWTAAKNSILSLLEEKSQSPLEAIELDALSIQNIQAHEAHIEILQGISDFLVDSNNRLNEVKEQVQADNIAALKSDLAKIIARRNRYEDAMIENCQAYSDELQAKSETESLRDQYRQELDDYRARIFPAYEEQINDYLNRFSASFRLGAVQSQNTRAGSAAFYSVLINENEVNVTAEVGPSFRNTLSAGDRSALALAFFFASLEHDPDLENKILVIDDPMTSLDEHRTLRTRQEILAISRRVHQTFVLSHSKPFLCALWNEADKDLSASLRVIRSGTGSEIVTWDVRNDSISDNDKRHEIVRRYINAADPNIERQVAEALRPMLEAFLRVAYPGHFPPGALLGYFINLCNQKVGGVDQILSAIDIAEIDELRNFANQFHHATNPASYTTAIINDAELTSYAQRVIRFASKS